MKPDNNNDTLESVTNEQRPPPNDIKELFAEGEDRILKKIERYRAFYAAVTYSDDEWEELEELQDVVAATLDIDQEIEAIIEIVNAPSERVQEVLDDELRDRPDEGEL